MPMLFLHGLGQSPAVWDMTLSRLPKDSAPLCPDLSGFLDGGTASYDTLYRNFSRCCESIPEPLSICGLSLGAVLALNYAIDHPENVTSMLLAAPQYRMPKTLLKFQSLIFRLLPASTFGDTGLLKNDFLSLTGSMSKLDFTGRLDRIVCPVTVVCGERDRANRKAARQLAERLKNASFVSIPDAGHEVNTDAPDELAALAALL